MNCCEIHAGKLRNQIQLQRQELTTDGAGGWEKDWTTYATVWAYVKPLSGTEGFVGMQVEDSITHEIAIRYLEDVRAADRVLFHEREMNIKEVINKEERDRWIVMRCQEGVAT